VEGWRPLSLVPAEILDQGTTHSGGKGRCLRNIPAWWLAGMNRIPARDLISSLVRTPQRHPARVLAQFLAPFCLLPYRIFSDLAGSYSGRFGPRHGPPRLWERIQEFAVSQK